MRNYYNSQLCYYRHCIKYYEQRIKDLEKKKAVDIINEAAIRHNEELKKNFNTTLYIVGTDPKLQPTIKKLQEF